VGRDATERGYASGIGLDTPPLLIREFKSVDASVDFDEVVVTHWAEVKALLGDP
jgi:hypothetical protein